MYINLDIPIKIGGQVYPSFNEFAQNFNSLPHESQRFFMTGIDGLGKFLKIGVREEFYVYLALIKTSSVTHIFVGEPGLPAHESKMKFLKKANRNDDIKS